jgi:DeoR/GlpR family transcriptional regulator of sugar metabolism
VPYERSLQIETRLQTVLRLIKTGEYSTPEIAQEIGVSIPTISRDVTALRQRGNAIRAERVGSVWHYVLEESARNGTRPGATRKRRKPR